MEQNDEERLLLLQLIEKSGNLDDLLGLGYEYFQITTFIKFEIASGNAKFENGKVSITDRGIDEKNGLLKALNIQNSGKFVRPRLSAKDAVEQININEIFVPSENELPF